MRKLMKVKIDPVIRLEKESATTTEKDLEKKDRALYRALKEELSEENPDPEVVNQILENRIQVLKLRDALREQRRSR